MESRLEIRTKSREAESVKEEGEREVLEPVSPTGQTWEAQFYLYQFLALRNLTPPLTTPFPPFHFFKMPFWPSIHASRAS
ncbi:hypothetical protein Ancab_006021, partial [Ancistrocladus abbreviatus]